MLLLTRSWSNILLRSLVIVFASGGALRVGELAPPVRVSARCVGALRGDGDGLHCVEPS